MGGALNCLWESGPGPRKWSSVIHSGYPEYPEPLKPAGRGSGWGKSPVHLDLTVASH